MTLADIVAQAKALSVQERKELVKELIDTFDEPTESRPRKSSAEIAEMLESMGPIELVDPQIEDPVEWVKAQRQKRKDQLKPYWGDER
jgi:polyhydroxyalkanoate synthesis regulator phasin